MRILAKAPRLGRLRPVVAVAWLAVTGTGLVAGLAANAAHATTTSTARPAQQLTAAPKPTIVLVHGAWADSSSWDGIVKRLQALGYTVDVPPNPLRGLPYDAQYLADFLGTIPGPIVLVGHSYGGMVITNAATGNVNVKALVYDDAYIPAQGDSVLSLTTAVPGSCLAKPDPSTVFNFVSYPNSPSVDADLYVKPSLFPGCFAGGIPAADAQALAAEQRPLAASALHEQSGPPAWAAIPSWAIVGTDDQVIPVAEQLAMAGNAKAHVTEVAAPHLSMITDPGVVTAVIVKAALATG
jgi:pimeloyl-ACP methyl ester carboxylesterase